jgi:hypothetical protein
LLTVAAALAVSVFAVPAAQASVSVRVESTSGTLVPEATVQLPVAPIAPPGAPADQTCAAATVVGALQAAVGDDWSGVWNDTTGLRIQRIRSVDVGDGSLRRWVAYVNYAYSNGSPCDAALAGTDINVLLYPACTGGTTQCFSGEPLLWSPVPDTVAPGVRLTVQAMEVTTDFSAGVGVTTRAPSVNAVVTGPNDSVRTDMYGRAIVTLTDKGPAMLRVTKSGRVRATATTCVTDGADGFCGTTTPPFVPFDPLNFCVTTGDDGECGTIDTRAPVGHITEPGQGKTFTGTTRVEGLKGTVDYDHSDIAEVRLGIKRQAQVTVTKYKKKRVRIKKRIRGKVRRVWVKKRVPVKRKVTRCYYWSNAATAFKVMKPCSSATPMFKVEGGDFFSYDFPSALPVGAYTLDAQPVDKVGNADSTPELGRNRVTFTVT